MNHIPAIVTTHQIFLAPIGRIDNCAAHCSVMIKDSHSFMEQFQPLSDLHIRLSSLMHTAFMDSKLSNFKLIGCSVEVFEFLRAILLHK